MMWEAQKAREAELIRKSRMEWFATIDGRTITDAAADVGMCQNSLGRLIQRAGYDWRRYPVAVVRKIRGTENMTSPFDGYSTPILAERTTRGLTQVGPPSSNLPMADRGITDDMIRNAWERTEVPLRKISKALGIPRSTLQARAGRLGLPPRDSANRKKVSTAEFSRVWAAGVSVEEIANHYGYANLNSVSVKRDRLGLPPRSHGGAHKPIKMAQYLEEKDAE